MITILSVRIGQTSIETYYFIETYSINVLSFECYKVSFFHLNVIKLDM